MRGEDDVRLTADRLGRLLVEPRRDAARVALLDDVGPALDVAEFFGISTRAAAALCRKWVERGFLAVADPSKKARRYQLAGKYEEFVSAEARSKRKA